MQARAATSQEVCSYPLWSHRAFTWRWHPLHLTCHSNKYACNKHLTYKMHAHGHMYTHSHFPIFVVSLWSHQSSLSAHEEANSILGCWFWESVCKVSVWHLGERYACAAWHYDSFDILDLNVAHTVLHHNMPLEWCILFSLLLFSNTNIWPELWRTDETVKVQITGKCVWF